MVKAHKVDLVHEVMGICQGDTHMQIAVDGGANVGVWTGPLAERFATVLAFEPARDTITTLQERMASRANVVFYQYALWDKVARLAIRGAAQKPDSHKLRYCVEMEHTSDVVGVPLDSLGIQTLGLIKLDVEGAELIALRGAKDTLLRCKPVVCFEAVDYMAQRYHYNANDSGAFLESLGASLVMQYGSDLVYSW